MYFDCKTRPCLIIPGRQGKYIFTQESFCLQGILNDITEHDTSCVDCKHKHMMKSGAPSDKSWCPAPSVTYRIPWFQQQNYILRVITLWFLVLSQFFIDGMGPFKYKSESNIATCYEYDFQEFS